MQDAAQDDSLLQIRRFTAPEVLQAGERLDFHRKEIVQQLTRYHQQVVETSASQYDAIARMAIAQAWLSRCDSSRKLVFIGAIYHQS